MQIAGLCNFVEVSFVFGGLFVCGCELLPSKFDVGNPLYLLGEGSGVAHIGEIICRRFCCISWVVFGGVVGPGSLLSFCHSTTDTQDCGWYALRHARAHRSEIHIVGMIQLFKWFYSNA